MCSLALANKTAYQVQEGRLFSVFRRYYAAHAEVVLKYYATLAPFPGWSMIRKQKNSVKLSSLHGSQQSHGKDRLIAEPTLLFW